MSFIQAGGQDKMFIMWLR